MTTKELTVVQSVTAEVFNNPEQVQDLLSKIEAIANDFKPDIETEEGRKEINDLAKKINRSKTAVDDIGKKEVARLKELPKKIDNQRKIFRDKMDDIKTKVREPLTKWEIEEESRKTNIKEKLLYIQEIGDKLQKEWQSIPMDSLDKDFNAIEGYKKENWDEYLERANDIINESLEKISDAIEKRKVYDEEQKELEELRALKAAKEKEEAERHAEEQAKKLEAERIEREKRIADEAKQKAIDDAKKAAERARIEAEEAVKRERERVAREKEAAEKEAKRKEANKQHVANIHKKAAVCLSNIDGVDYDIGVAIVKSIVRGEIDGIKIVY